MSTGRSLSGQLLPLLPIKPISVVTVDCNLFMVFRNILSEVNCSENPFFTNDKLGSDLGWNCYPHFKDYVSKFRPQTIIRRIVTTAVVTEDFYVTNFTLEIKFKAS